MKKQIIITLLVTILVSAGTITIAKITPPLLISTDDTEYTSGETVTIYISNVGKIPKTIRSGFYVTTENNQPVYDPFWAIIWICILPGYSIDYVWDQTYANSPYGDYGEQVTPGTYYVKQFDTPRYAEITITYYSPKIFSHLFLLTIIK